jgi:two-component system chemotaxis sensor kinase CheA
LHVVRNAVAHGIEKREERTRAGKAAKGRIELCVERRDHRVAFVCRDDGRGIDVGDVRRVAVQRGIVGAAEAKALSEQAARDLLFLPGFSTSHEVTGLSGRGVGLDVVRETARRFKGEATIASERGRMTCVELRLPVSMSSLTALLVEIGGDVLAIPLEAACGARQVDDGNIVRTGASESIVVDDEVVPFAPLARLLGRTGPQARSRARWSALVLRAEGRSGAVGVDRFRGTREFVMKPLPELAGAIPLVLGASLDADGNAQLMLDPAALLEAARVVREITNEHSPAQRPPILVIDDSLTTRMLEKSILESAGYRVDLATSAEEALEMARRHRYGLFVCDVEMPGMDGYGFVATTRADAVLRETPVIMVTSLSSAEDRKRGIDAGASEFIVKGDFDQGRLLEHIRALIG